MRFSAFILLFLHLFSFGQLVDDFEDGSFLTTPIWGGDISKFVIEKGSLKSNSTIVSDQFYLSTKNSSIVLEEWQINVNMRFSTSSANYTDIFLISDSEDLTQVSNGYFVRIGNTKDEISLYKIENGSTSQLTDGTDNRTQNKDINLKVLRSAIGEWEIYADFDGGENFALEGSNVDNSITTSEYFGILIKQSTASFHGKHFFDDVYVGKKIVDTESPVITSYVLPNRNTIELQFNEPIDYSDASFSLDKGYGQPDAIATNGNTINLTYNNALVTGTYNLTIDRIKDVAGNQADTVLEVLVNFPETPAVGDIIFTEIFPDPTPSVGLPEAEFIEIYNDNRNDKTLSLKDCYLSDGGNPAFFPNIDLLPYEYVILTKTSNVELFEQYGKVIGLSNFPTLNNDGDHLKLYNSEGVLIEDLNYNDNFYQDESREDGGYTIERVYFKNECDLLTSWRASINKGGGTPGDESSVLFNSADTVAPEILQIEAIFPSTLNILLSENISDELLGLNNFTFPNNDNLVLSISQVENSVVLTLLNDLKKNYSYQLKINRIGDCIGNSQLNLLNEIITTESPTRGDLVFNEILFNPLEDGVDYIELYNKSEKFIDLSELKLARYNTERENITAITDSKVILFPETYALLTTDTNSTKTQYENAQNLELVDKLPPMNNDEGTLLLLDSDLNPLDSLCYSEDQHFKLLSDVDGISLERINFEGNSWNKNLWHSASSSEDFGTPGFQNSQFVVGRLTKSAFSLAANTISPDGDGYQDLLALNYNVGNGVTLNGYVFNLSGKLVSHIHNQETLATEGIITWNGFLENGTKIPVGNYILLLESYNLDGETTKQKIAFSVQGNF